MKGLNILFKSILIVFVFIIFHYFMNFVHEFSHLAVAIIFNYKINEFYVSFFCGYVKCSYGSIECVYYYGLICIAGSIGSLTILTPIFIISYLFKFKWINLIACIEIYKEAVYWSMGFFWTHGDPSDLLAWALQYEVSFVLNNYNNIIIIMSCLAIFMLYMMTKISYGKLVELKKKK